MGRVSGIRSERAGGLLRRHAAGVRTRANHADGENDVQHADAADGAAKRGMQEQRHQRGEMAQEIILFPEGGPGKIQEQSSHLEAKNDKNGAKHAVHEREKSETPETAG